MSHSDLVTTLEQFRTEVYRDFDLRRDALFELLDATTVAGLVPSLVYLSLSGVHRRGWGSLYDASPRGRWTSWRCASSCAGGP